MVKLDLNIKVEKPVVENVEDGVDDKGKAKFKEVEVSAPELATRWIGIMLERAINKPQVDTRTGRLTPTAQVTMEVQRKYGKVMSALEGNVAGVAELADDDFAFLNRKFHQAEMSVQRDINKLLMDIDDKILQAAASGSGKEK